MINNQSELDGPKDAATSKGPNASAVGANALSPDYPKVAPGRKEKSVGDAGSIDFDSNTRAREGIDRIEGNSPSLAHSPRHARARETPRKYGRNTGGIGLSAPDGRRWSYRGKRARVAEMLATMPQGVTQWDCWPWHTRLGGTIHALRRDGLEISTELEGEYGHARYRLHMPGCLIIQAENSGESVNLHRQAP